ncbi:MAG TPA: hypothetical protein VFD70_15060 [Anaerolineae bacterium]|nr:hypothetical protein [Anaerolineae bacterium]
MSEEQTDLPETTPVEPVTLWAWEEPRLVVHGDAREITRTPKKPIGTSDGGTMSNTFD